MTPAEEFLANMLNFAGGALVALFVVGIAVLALFEPREGKYEREDRLHW